MAATTQKLNYSSVPPRATSSRAIRNEVVPSNGQSFNMNQTIILDVPANLNNTFCDFQSSYVKLKFTNNDAVDLNFENGGFPACIRRIVLELGGQTLFSCDSWNVLYEMMLTLDTANQFRGNAGKRLFGAGAGVGVSVATGASRTVCFPLVLTPLVGATKYFPLFGRDRLRIRLELDTAARSLIAGDADITDADITIDECSLVMYNLELGSDVMSQVAAASGGSFKMTMPSYQHHQSSLGNTDSTLVSTLGFSMSSLNRILVAQQISNTVANNSRIANRNRIFLKRFFVTIGGVKYPMKDLQSLNTADDLGAGSEILAEALISERSLCSWAHDSSVETGAGWSSNETLGVSANQTGTFLIDLDLESQRVQGGEGSLGLVAGINCVGQQVQATFEYGANRVYDHVINIFGEHTIMCSLDLNTLTWSIAV
jgi:hypothetical protein